MTEDKSILKSSKSLKDFQTVYCSIESWYAELKGKRKSWVDDNWKSMLEKFIEYAEQSLEESLPEEDQYKDTCPDCGIVCHIDVPIACLVNPSTKEDKMVCQDCWDCFKKEYKQEGFFNTDTMCEDDKGFKVIYNIETGGWESIEDHCEECKEVSPC